MQCKKEMAKGAFTEEECYLRLKRWLTAGLQDDSWPANRREYHVSMGGMHLQDFAVGRSSQQLDALVQHSA